MLFFPSQGGSRKIFVKSIACTNTLYPMLTSNKHYHFRLSELLMDFSHYIDRLVSFDTLCCRKTTQCYWSVLTPKL